MMWDNVWRIGLYFWKWFPHNIFALFFRNSTQPKHGGYIFLAQPQQAARLSSSHPATRCCFLLFLLLSFHPLQSVNLNVKGRFEVKTWRAPPAAAVPLSSAATMSMTFLWPTAAWLSFTQTDQRWPFESRETSQLEKSRGKGTLSRNAFSDECWNHELISHKQKTNRHFHNHLTRHTILSMV